MTQSKCRDNTVWCIIPVYNNGATLTRVVQGCKEQIQNILIVDDGSTDIDVSRIADEAQVDLITHECNKGKGAALMTGLDYVHQKGAAYAITIDADGQHLPCDMEKFVAAVEGQEDLLVIGSRDFSVDNVPGSSKFGRKFANFWFRVETGLSLDDCQSGFRAYPVNYIKKLTLRGQHYNFETEVIAKAAWAGLKFKTVGIGVHYPPQAQRVSHFRSVVDNLRISQTHSLLVLRRLWPWGHHKLIERKDADLHKDLAKHPVKALKYLLRENATPEGLAAAAAVGIILAVLPLVGVHTIAIIYVTTRLHLNKVMAVNIQHLCMPPFVPVMCIELGHYLRHGRWLTEVSMDVIFYQALDRVWEWLLGSLIVAPLLAVVVGGIVYMLAKLLQRRSEEEMARA